MKKENESFDVTMGSYDGAEVCELVGLFILSKLTNVAGMDSIGLYRDDGLAVLYVVALGGQQRKYERR